MVTVEPERVGPREATSKPLSPEAKGKILEFSVWMLNQGYAEDTVKVRSKFLRFLVRRGADLSDPENVKGIIARQRSWSDGVKKIVVLAYSCLLRMEGRSWSPPRYKHERKKPFIPLEKELDQLIAGCGKKTATFLQGLKDTGADPGELWRIEWTDLDLKRKKVRINHPVKGHNSRILPISEKWINMLERLPKKSNVVFGGGDLTGHSRNFRRQRYRLALKLNNPRLRNITFRTFRHWKATMEYHKTPDIYQIKWLLGHKRLTSTEFYVTIEKELFQDDVENEYHIRIAKTLEQDRQFLEAGFEYVTDRDGDKIYRKRK